MTKTGKYAGIKDTLVRDKAQDGLFVRTRDDGDKTATSFVVIYRVGKQQRKMTLTKGLSRDQARKIAKNILAKVELGQDPQGEKTAKRQQDVVGTAKAVFDDFIAHQSTRRRPSSLEATKRYLLEYAKPLHGLKLDASLGRAQITSVLKTAAKDHGPVAADRCRSALSAAFAWAIGEGACTADFHNPVAGTNKYAEQNGGRERVLSDDEIKIIWKACGDDDFGRIVRLLLLTGCRRDEVARLKWSEFKMKGQKGALVDAWIELPPERTKNGRAFEVPLSYPAFGLIAMGQHCSVDLENGYVFGRYDSSKGFSGFSKAKKHFDAKLDGVEPWTLHDLRRTAATGMADIGVQPHVIEAALNHISGHKSGVAGVYNRSTYAAEKRAALEAWAQRIAVITGKNVTDIGKHRKPKAG
jgi:integrase